MATRALSVQELLSELNNAIKSPMDPYHRKLIRRTITTLNAFVDLVGEVEAGPNEIPTSLPGVADRIKDSD